MNRECVCNCCDSIKITQEFGLVSAFTAKRVFQEKPTLTKLFRCLDCGYSWSERGLSDSEIQNLYKDYRGEAYFEQRNKCEPWYTKKYHENIGSVNEMAKRRGVMSCALLEAEAIVGARVPGIVLDHGGDKGQLLKDLQDDVKLVYDLSGVATEAWAKSVSELSELENACSLVLSCKVLEHVNDPCSMIKDFAKLLIKEGWLYVEVPFENWRQSCSQSKIRKIFLTKILSNSIILKTLDFISTALRIKFKWLPVFCFWSLREHLNFFTHESLKAIVEKNNLNVVLIKTDISGIILIAKK